MFNYYGLIFMAVIMIPNIFFALLHKEGFENKYSNNVVEILEKVGRFGCFGFMIINVPYICLGFWFNNALQLYLIVNSVLCLIYCLAWLIYWKKDGVFKALVLSILPSVIFIFSGIMLLNISLIITSVIFAFSHIFVSYKNSIL